jgi:hypothetical protein
VPAHLLDAADTVRLAAAAPITPSKQQTGGMLYSRDFKSAFYPGYGVREFQAFNIVDEDLLWPRSWRVFEAMRRDPQIQGLLSSVFLPIRHLEWFVDTDSASPAVAQYISEDLGLPLMGEAASDFTKGIQFDEHLRLALLAMVHGHRYFEESGVTDPDGRYRIRELRDNPPHSIEQIFINAQGGLEGIRVPGRDPKQGPYVDLTEDRLVSYIWDREGADWAGRSLLVGIKDMWEQKYRLLSANTQMMVRFAGVPIATTTDPNIKEDAHTAASEMAQAIHAGYGAGGALPFGMDMKVLGIEGSVPDIVKSCEYIDAQMARAFLQMFAELGKVGSRALGTTLLDHYTLGVMAVAKWVRHNMNTLVDRIVERNEGPDAPRPVIGFRADDHEDLTPENLVALIDSGAIVVDDDLEATIRARGNLPPRNPAEVGRTPPKATPASGGSSAHDFALNASAATKDPVTVTPAPGTPAALSKTDFTALQAAHAATVQHLAEAWVTVQGAQIAAVGTQIAALSTIAGIATIAAPVLGVTLLAQTLDPVVQHGAETVINEADAQGHHLPHVDLTSADARIEQAATATAGVLADQVTLAAKSKAMQIAGPDAHMPDVADAVVEHLQNQAGAQRDYELAGLVSQAQNEGRFAALDAAPAGTQFYSSELNDANTCDLCASEDDTNFPSMAEARRDYPAGGFLGCLGGKRCRGTIVAVFGEVPGQA